MRVKYILFLFSLFSIITVSSELYSVNNNYKKTFLSIYNRQVKASDEFAEEIEKKWLEFINKNKKNPLVIEAKYCLARLYSGGKLGDDKYLTYLKKIINNYEGDKSNLLYLKMLTTYGQVIASPAKRKIIFRTVLDYVDEGITLPQIIKVSKNINNAMKQLRTGAVWAELNEETRSISHQKERMLKAIKIKNDLIQRNDGKILEGLVFEWIRQDQKRFLNQRTNYARDRKASESKIVSSPEGAKGNIHSNPIVVPDKNYKASKKKGSIDFYTHLMGLLFLCVGVYITTTSVIKKKKL